MDRVGQGRGRDLPRPRERGVAPDLASAGFAPGLRAVAAASRKGPRPEGVLTMASQRPGSPPVHRIHIFLRFARFQAWNAEYAELWECSVPTR